MHTYNYAYENCMHITITSTKKSRSQLTNGGEGFHLVSPHHSCWPCCKETWVARWKFHRIRRLIAWSLKAIKTLSEWKKLNRNTLEILGSWRFFHVFSLWNLLNSSWQLWKHPTSKSGLVQLPCGDLGVVMVLLSQGATPHVSRGPMGFDDSINLFKPPQIISTSNFSLSKLP